MNLGLGFGIWGGTFLGEAYLPINLVDYTNKPELDIGSISLNSNIDVIRPSLDSSRESVYYGVTSDKPTLTVDIKPIIGLNK